MNAWTRGSSRRAVTIALAVSLPLGYFSYLTATDYQKNPARVAFIMNIQELSPSVRDISCSANAITDIIVTCAFRIGAEDFPSLLMGWNFESERLSGDGRDYGMDGKVGPSFDAALRYVAHPESFERGGEVNLVTNRERTIVVANRYEE